MAAQERGVSLWDAARQRLDEAMRKRGVNQSELARRLHVKPGTVNQWFRGKRPAQPKAEQLAGIPNALGISGHWLLTGDGTMDDQPEEAQRILGEIRRLLG